MLRDITVILLEGTPTVISMGEVAGCLSGIPHVKVARDVHVWCIDEQKIALSAHVQVTSDITVSQTERCYSK